MPTSDFIFEEGEAIDVGSHGDHSYVFAEGEPVPDTGESTFIFESGVGLGGGGVIEDFERGNLDPYDTSNDGGYFTVTNTNPLNGQYSLRLELTYSDNNRYTIASTSGLPSYPEPGDKFAFWYRAGGTAGDKTSFYWNVDGPTNDNVGYEIWVNQSDGGPNYEKAVLRKDGNHLIDPGNGTWDAQADSWYEIIIDWVDNGGSYDFTLEVRDINGNTVQGPGSATDSSPLPYIQGIEWKYGVAGTFGTDTTIVYFDYAHKLSG